MDWPASSRAPQLPHRAVVAIPRVGESGAALRLAGALRLFWYIRGHLEEGRQWLEQSLEACPDPQPGAQAKALNGVGIIAYRQGDFAAARLAYGACIAAYRLAGDEHGVGLVLGNLGMVATDEGDYDTGRELFEQSLAVLEDLGDERGVANALGNLGTVASEQGDFDAARCVLRAITRVGTPARGRLGSRLRPAQPGPAGRRHG